MVSPRFQARLRAKESQMKLRLAFIASAIVLSAGTGVSLADDAYPEGCVSCHAEADMTVGAMLAELGHKKIDNMVETVPTDCFECHSEDGGFGELYEFIHPAHYAADSKFVAEFEGKCTHCHAMDVESGEVSVKSGAKNW